MSLFDHITLSEEVGRGEVEDLLLRAILSDPGGDHYSLVEGLNKAHRFFREEEEDLSTRQAEGLFHEVFLRTSAFLDEGDDCPVGLPDVVAYCPSHIWAKRLILRLAQAMARRYDAQTNAYYSFFREEKRT